MSSIRSTTYSVPTDEPGIQMYNRVTPSDPWTHTSQINTAYTGLYHIKTIAGGSTAGFHKLLQCGALLPFNTVEITTLKRTYLPGFYAATTNPPEVGTRKDEGPHGYTAISGWSLSEGYPDPAVFGSCVNGAAADARSAVMDALTFMAEYRQLQKLYRTTLERVGAHGLRAAKNAWRFKNRREAFASLWLEYRYGWLPLCYSLDDALQAFKAAKRGFVTGKASQTVSFSDSAVVDSSSLTLSDIETEFVNAEHVVRGWAAANIANSLGDWGNDPIKTAWELVPFSFVIDWFIQVGTWIDTWSPFQPGTIMQSGVSCKSTIVREKMRDLQWLPAATSTGGMTQPMRVREEIERYTRFAMLPSLPGWNPRITPERLIDAVALAIATKARVFRALLR